MSVLDNPRHERFAQNLASGMTQDAAYEAAGYNKSTSAAARLSADVRICERVASLLDKGAKQTESALSAKQRFIERAYEKAAAALESVTLATAQDVKALLDSALAADKDQRVTDGGISDRTASVADGARRAGQLVDQLEQRLRGAGGDRTAPTVAQSGSA